MYRETTGLPAQKIHPRDLVPVSSPPFPYHQQEKVHEHLRLSWVPQMQAPALNRTKAIY